MAMTATRMKAGSSDRRSDFICESVSREDWPLCPASCRTRSTVSTRTPLSIGGGAGTGACLQKAAKLVGDAAFTVTAVHSLRRSAPRARRDDLRAEPPPDPRGRGDPHHAGSRGRVRATRPAVLGGQGLDRAAPAGREGLLARALPVPAHARGHGPQL